MSLDKSLECFIEVRKSIVDIKLASEVVWFKNASESSEFNLFTEKPEKYLRFCFPNFGLLIKVCGVYTKLRIMVCNIKANIATGDININFVSQNIVYLVIIHPQAPFLALIGASAFAFNKYPHKPYIF